MFKTLLYKELKLEFRTKETYLSMLILGAVLIFLFSVSMGQLIGTMVHPITFFWIIVFLIFSINDLFFIPSKITDCIKGFSTTSIYKIINGS